MMETSALHSYLNPLIVEAQMFLNSLETYSAIYKNIDVNLCEVLKNVVFGIDKFLEQNHTNLKDTDNQPVISPKDVSVIRSIYHCTVCKRDLGNTAEKAAMHLANKHIEPVAAIPKVRRERVRKREERQKVPKLPKKAKMLITGDLKPFFSSHVQVGEKLKNIPEYGEIENELLKILQPLYGGESIKIYRFGSRMTGISTRNSDLDIYVDIGNNFYNFENRATPQTMAYLHTAEKALKSNKDWNKILFISGARVPIIKVCHARTNIDCDIGFSNSLSFFNTKLLNYIFEQQPIALRISIFMKKWVERTGLSLHITTYKLTLMVIYFLQTKNFLPSIEALQTNLDSVVHIGPWIGSFFEKTLKELNLPFVDLSPTKCRQLLKEFCQFYASFDYKIYAICPYIGRPCIEINQLEDMLPERYKTYVQRFGSNCALRLKAPIVVQDPLQLNHNVALRLSQRNLKIFCDYMKQSADVFAELKI